ncbi:RICIN domain-containing protein [Kitasatospora sp. NPDC002965]|uniref:RICIN domain-containing protein n=1 Tax=Kitasatospora sp. NPDC002965 TaxID=3154775 RepID=UPI0033BB1DBE
MSLVTALLAVGVSITPMAGGTAHAAEFAGNPCPAAESMYCTRLFLDGGVALGVDTQRSQENQVMLTPLGSGPNRAWRLTPNWDNGTFRIQNVSLGKCLSTPNNKFTPYRDRAPVYLESCGADHAQDWYAHPTPTGFMIRTTYSNLCFYPNSSNINPGVSTLVYSCKGNEAQSWEVPFGHEANQPPVRGPRQLAITYATKVCQDSPKKCSWDMESESPAEMLPESCESIAWRNNGPEDATHTFVVTNTNGWSHEIGTEIELGLETGALSSLIAKVSVKVKFSFKKVWSGSQAVGNQMSGKVRPGEYGWVTLSRAATKITGTWTFSVDDLPWTTRDTIAMPMMSDAKGQPSLYIVNSSPKPPVCL